MSIQLRTDEMMEALQHSDHPMAADIIARFERLADEAAVYVTEALDLEVHGDAYFEGLSFAGLCVAFGPSSKTQELPYFFDAYHGFAVADEGREFIEMQMEMKGDQS